MTNKKISNFMIFSGFFTMMMNLMIGKKMVLFLIDMRAIAGNGCDIRTKRKFIFCFRFKRFKLRPSSVSDLLNSVSLTTNSAMNRSFFQLEKMKRLKDSNFWLNSHFMAIGNGNKNYFQFCFNGFWQISFDV